MEKRSLFDPVTFPVLKKTMEIIGVFSPSGQMSEDILCTCAGTDTGERTCRSLSESGILIPVLKNFLEKNFRLI